MNCTAALKPDGLQRTTFLLAITKPGRLYVSTPILEEYANVLSRPELSIRRGLWLQLLQLIKNHGHLVACRSKNVSTRKACRRASLTT
jgi:hypothetical protein